MGANRRYVQGQISNRVIGSDEGSGTIWKLISLISDESNKVEDKKTKSNYVPDPKEETNHDPEVWA